nr:DUF2778 domain-containing protein [Rhodopseudomonas sp. B29]
MIGCAWLVYANTVGASVYPTVGSPIVVASYAPSNSAKAPPEAHSFAARFQPLAAAAAAAPQLMASIVLKAAMKRQEEKSVQVASADPNDVPVTASTQAAEPTKTGHRYYALLDPNYSFGFLPDRFKRPAQNNADEVADVPPQKADAKVAVAPAPAPVKLAVAVPLPPEKKSVAAVAAPISRNPYSQAALVARAKAAILASASHAKAGFFEKLFGKTDSPALAYASADASDVADVGEARNNAFAPSDEDRYTAVYDISAKTVYMPDGTKLEAHSGLGSRLDDPRSANIRMQGVTPPHIYDLKLREALFHGVAAIRLTPVGGEEAIHGRNGLLAHTFMLGPRGDSNGCVSFRDYNAFLQAYKRGEVKKLVVVGSMT